MRQRLEALMRQPGFLPGLVAGIVVTALMGAVLWAINGDNEPPAAASKEPVPVSASDPEPSEAPTVLAPSTEDSPSEDSGAPTPVVASGEPATKLPSGKKVSFQIGAFYKKCMVGGLDELDYLKTHDAAVAAFEKRHDAARA